MNILIIRLSSMGDIILTLPIIKVIKKNYPSAQIAYLTQKLCTDLIKTDENVSNVYTYKRDTRRAQEESFYKEDFDLIIDLQNNKRSREITSKFNNLEIRRFHKKRLKRTILLLFHLNLFRKKERIVAEYIKAALPNKTDVKDIPELSLAHFSNNAKEKSIAILPFAAWENKMWNLENYKTVADYFANKNYKILIFGGPEDQIKADELSKEIGSNATSFEGKIPLTETAQKLSTCIVSIGNDTGLSHLARACNVKSVIIFGSTVKEFGFYPYGKPAYKTLETSEKCRPCHPHGGKRCKRKERYCLTKITPKIAIKAIENLISEADSYHQ